VDHSQLIQISKEIAKYFVYGCEGEQYLSLIESFRIAKTRNSLIEAICSLLQYGESLASQGKHPLKITKQEWKGLCQFIRRAEIDNVRRFHVAMISYISTVELEKIQQMEQYVAKLLSDRG
jgi:hypothetical protein